MLLSNVLAAVKAAHKATGAPGEVVGLRNDGRYVVALDAFRRKVFRMDINIEKMRVRVNPAWTAYDNGKKTPKRRAVTLPIPTSEQGHLHKIL